MSDYDVMDKSMAGSIFGLQAGVDTKACVSPDGIEFGRPVFSYMDHEDEVSAFAIDFCKMEMGADYVLDNVINATIDGVAIDPVDWTDDHDTTAGLVAAAINALDGVECILDPGDATNRTYFIRKRGVTIDDTVTITVTGGASQATATYTYYSSQVYVGLSVKTQNSAGLYELGDAVNIGSVAEIMCQVAGDVYAYNQALVYNDPTSDDFGKVTLDSSNGTTIGGYVYESVADGELAKVRTLLPTAMSSYASAFLPS